MSDQFVGEIRLFPFNFAPSGWQICQGQLLSISQHTALFSLIGTFYGGNGVNNFALPDLRGRVPIHQGNGPGLSTIVLGEQGGETAVTVLSNQLPVHTHAMTALAHSATVTTPATGTYPAEGHGQGRGSYKIRTFAQSGTQTPLAPAAVGTVGGGVQHNNIQPSLAVTWCIALVGIFPARN